MQGVSGEKDRRHITAAFSTRLVRLARVAATARPARAVPANARPANTIALSTRANAAAASGVIGAATRTPGLTRTAARAELRSTLGAVNTVAQNAGAADAVKLLRHVRTSNDARELATFTTRFGRRSRAVVELTGKTALRDFRVAVRGARVLIAFLWSLVGWLLGLLGLKLI